MPPSPRQGVEQTASLYSGQHPAPRRAPVEVGGSVNAAAADIGVQHFHPAGRKRCGRSLRGCPSGRLSVVLNPAQRRRPSLASGHFTIGEQRRHRRHRARFLNINSPLRCSAVPGSVVHRRHHARSRNPRHHGTGVNRQPARATSCRKSATVIFNVLTRMLRRSGRWQAAIKSSKEMRYIAAPLV